jgi:paraquat-inducible protein A
MTIEPNNLGCPECDLLITHRELTPGERATCPRCGFVLSVCYADPEIRALSFAIAAVVFLAIALSYPFLTINSSGVESSVTLLHVVWYLADYGANTVAALVFMIIVLMPAFTLSTIILLASMLLRERYPNWMLPVTRWLFHSNTWAMVEVFSIGVIVSLVKINSMAKVDIGLSFWAYLAFTVMFLLAGSSLDRLNVWSTIGRLRGSF